MRHLILYHTAHSLSNYFAQIFLILSGFSACRRRGLPRPIAIPRPSPRDPLHPKFHLAFGVAESPQGDSLYASPAGPYFSIKKSNQKSLGVLPETPYASEPSRPETLRIPGAGLDDADKEPQAHFNLVPANRLQEVTLSSLWVEQAAICPDGPSPATGEGDGVRSRAPPVADAARRSTRSGRKNRASEQREDFFGHRKAVGADAPAATLGAYLCAVRTMLLHRSYPALQATERGSSRGNPSPLTLFCFLLQEQKEGLRGERY